MNLTISEKPSTNKFPTICLNMIVKNESNVIVNTLNNLFKYINFDYWVISDTGSTDGTQQIINDYFLKKGIPGELVSHEWRDFGYNRSKALESAYDKTDYLLIFDADDKINGDLILPFNTIPKNKWVDRYMLKFGKGFEYVRPLLINNHKKWEFKGVLHEFLSNKEPINEENGVVEGDYFIDSGRTGNRSQNPTKYYDDAMILEKAYQSELSLPDKGLSGRYAFYCARSYKDAGNKYHNKAIEWYKKVLDINNHWNQEKYYSAQEIGMIYREKNDMENSLKYLLKTLEYDNERIEGLIMAIEYLYNSNQYVLINALYHRYKNYNKNPNEKLFINKHFYQDKLEFYNGITAYNVHDKETGYNCCKQVLINQIVGKSELGVTINNLFCCYKDLLENDKNTLSLFKALDTLLCNDNDIVNNKIAIELWNFLFEKNKSLFTNLNKNIVKQIQKALQHHKANPDKNKVLITFTTCKRLDLFKQTINSFMNHCNDIDMISHWFCVDDNSTTEDRKYMKSTYNWIEYYMKNIDEKGHRSSMNIIWNKLQTMKPKYWIHMEDDFLFYHPMNYIKESIEVLSNNNHNIKQIVFNRNYAETIEHYRVKSHLSMKTPPLYSNILLQDHRPNENITNVQNSHYWPHYSFRPSMTLVKPILSLGNYDTPNQFFERDYADKWNDANYKTAFFNRITHRHIGRLTSEMNSDKKNAYQLNNESQFFENKSQLKNNNFKVVNLTRRPDRKKAITTLFKDHNVKDYTFYKAIDGKELKSTNELKKIFDGNDFGNRTGVIGCALTHLKLWKELIEDNDNNYYLIFEDDITLTQNKFNERLNSLKPEFEKNELLFLGYHMFSNKRKEFETIYETISDETQLKIETINKELYIGGTFAYSINKIGAKILIEHIERNGIKHGIDYIMKITPNLNITELQPLIVYSEWDETGHNPVDTDIQTNSDSLDFTQTIEDQFKFVKNLDQIGNDLYFKPGTITECMLNALSDAKCIGFNTLGFFKNKIDNLTSSQYFKETDGMYIKKQKGMNHVPMRIKMLCNWCSSEQLCKEWSNMYMDMNRDGHNYKNIKMTSSNNPDEIDYYVIINSPQPTDHYVAERTIIFQMEPWVSDPQKNWGVKTWGEWATPDPSKFFKVFTHKTQLNNVQWQIDYPFYTVPIVCDDRKNKIATICSKKNFDDGHQLRNNFIKYIDSSSESSSISIDVFGRENYHQFTTSYKGPVPDDNKYNVYSRYKYCLSSENNSENNYATEKLWEAILCESLCFYWGCPNLEEYIDEKAFVRLPLEDPAAALKIIQQAMAEDWWTQRIEVIKQMKERILNKLGFFPLLESILK